MVSLLKPYLYFSKIFRVFHPNIDQLRSTYNLSGLIAINPLSMINSELIITFFKVIVLSIPLVIIFVIDDVLHLVLI